MTVPSTTLPSESVLQALMMALLSEKSSKQCGLFPLATNRTWIFSRGMMPLGSLS